MKKKMLKTWRIPLIMLIVSAVLLIVLTIFDYGYSVLGGIWLMLTILGIPGSVIWAIYTTITDIIYFKKHPEDPNMEYDEPSVARESITAIKKEVLSVKLMNSEDRVKYFAFRFGGVAIIVLSIFIMFKGYLYEPVIVIASLILIAGATLIVISGNYKPDDVVVSETCGTAKSLKTGGYSTFLFDLDGTLTDPGEGITNSVMHALKYYGIEVADRTELYPFIGPPLTESFMKYYGFDESQALEAVEHYREYFKDKGIFENVVYDGIPEVLAELKAGGAKIVLATSKPEEFANRILEHFNLSQYFDVVCGATFDGTRSKKCDIIKYALDTLKVRSKKGILMVGDRENDVEGAKANGIDSLGVLYGYGNMGELNDAGATYIVTEPREITNFA